MKLIEFKEGIGFKSIAFTPDGRKAYVICGVLDDAIVLDAQKREVTGEIKINLGG